jgi:hypothetical protein
LRGELRSPPSTEAVDGTRRHGDTEARLEDLVEEATVDAYGDAEQAAGFFTMMENDLAMPFLTQVLGVDVTVERVDMTDADEIIAVCKRGAKRQKIPILDLPLPSFPPKGAEWIAAYRHWRRDSPDPAGFR